ncbi:MAG: class I SAM-dependent methyltransferase [Gammaproteobacteria bacterium]|nr:class I SAM-dependent methyltransferase [Gammaproteobacteria bacterium]MBU1723559.1 class I SAM-dependent methyltransferase [Gammaproteobacteria bacterium]MBU2004117.1 class I SAM-dependent methyltransferase [Gammaproteobacteria bacterium]
MPAPAFADFRVDPDTGFKVWRLGGNGEEMGRKLPHPDGNGSITLLHAQHFYSRTPPSNRNETHVLSAGGQGKPYAALWRLEDKQLVAWVPAATPETHIQQRQLLWDKQADNVYWFTQGNSLIRATIDFTTHKTRTEVWDTFPDFDYVTFGFGEGNFSDDGKRLVLAGSAQDTKGIYIQPYEVSRKHALPRRKVAEHEEAFDWASTDPSGKYIVLAQYRPAEKTLVIPFEQAATATPRLILDDVKHSDFVLDPGGEPWLVYGNWRGLSAIRLADAKSRSVLPRKADPDQEPRAEDNASGHVARIPAMPGWALLSRSRDGSLLQVDISGQGETRYIGNSRHGRDPKEATNKQAAQRWGVTHEGEVTMYKREARAASSASGRYAFFVSDYHVYATPEGGYDPEPEPSRAYLNLIEITPRK